MEDHVLLVQIDSTLTAICDLQGGMERIKNTAFPERVVRVSWAFVWLSAIFMIAVFTEPRGQVYVLGAIGIAIIVFAIMLVKQLSDDLVDPFENRDNDTPMTALCRTIEIDVRAQLGETELPPPLEPVNGVLM